jgi:carbon starvation protein
LAKRQVGTAFAVITAGFLAFYDGTGKGALKLWPLFGSVNQLLASLSLMIITIYLAKQKIRAVYTFLPMIFMIVITCWALTLNLNNFFLTGNWLLFFIGIFIFALQVWLIIEGLIIWKKIKSLQ